MYCTFYNTPAGCAFYEEIPEQLPANYYNSYQRYTSGPEFEKESEARYWVENYNKRGNDARQKYEDAQAALAIR